MLKLNNIIIIIKKLFLEPEKRDFLQFNFKSLEEAAEFKNNTVGR